MTGDVMLFAGTVVMMRSFVRLVIENSRDERVPRNLMEAAAISMRSQLEVDLGLHPATTEVLKVFEAARDVEDR